MHLLHCDNQDDALLEAAVSAAAACAAYAPQRSLLHAHGIERATGKYAPPVHVLVFMLPLQLQFCPATPQPCERQRCQQPACS
jgi:hypothetical protein